MGIKRAWRLPLKLLVLVLLSAGLTEGLSRGGYLQWAERRLQDLHFQWQGRRDEPLQVAIVAIDEDSLALYPEDPMLFWTDRLALAVERLRQVGVPFVGLDMLYSISPERWLSKLGGAQQQSTRDYDRAFREQLSSGQLLLVASRSGSGAPGAEQRGGKVGQVRQGVTRVRTATPYRPGRFTGRGRWPGAALPHRTRQRGCACATAGRTAAAEPAGSTRGTRHRPGCAG